MFYFNSLQMMSDVNNDEVLGYLKKGNYKLTDCRLEHVESLENFNVLLSFSNGNSLVTLSFYYSTELGAIVMRISKSTDEDCVRSLTSRIDFTFITGYEVCDLKRYNLI